MGDVAMTVPVIRALVQQHQNVKVTIVSRPFFQPFFANIDRVDFFGVDLKERHKGFWGIYRLFQDLKKKKIDFVADFHNVLRSKLLRTFFKASGVKIAFTDKGRAEKKELTRSKNKIFKPLKTMIKRHIDTLNTLGFSVDVSTPKFPKKSILPDKVTSIIEKKDTHKWIGIAPFAQYQTKVYPFDLMQKTIELLSENNNFRIFLFGGKEEIVQLNKLQQNLPNVAVIAGKIDFIDELKIIQHLDVMLSMDSGNAHIAAMYGIPVVTLWGNTHPYAGFVPFNQPLSNCLVADREKFPLLPTSIYGNKKIDGYENAMRTIAPKDILSVINSNLNV